MDDKLKQRMLWGVVGFNLTVIIYMIATSFSGSPSYLMGTVTRFLIGAGIGLVVGGILFALAAMTQK